MPTIDFLDNATGVLSGPGGNAVGAPPGVIGVTVPVLFNGYLNIVTPGTYTFNITSDDGSQLYIDGVMVIDDDGGHGLVLGTASVSLTAGLHAFQERYFNNGTGAGDIVTYSGPDTNFVTVPIPASALANNLGSAGTLQITNASSLGLGPVSLSNGVLQANNAVTLTNTITLSGGPLPVVLAGSNITIANPALLGGNTALSVNNTTTFNSDLANSPLIQAGSFGTTGLTLTSQPVVAGATTYTGQSGNLVFTAAVNYTGPTTVSASTLTLSGNGALNETAGTNTVQTLFFPTYTTNILEGDDTGGTFTLTYSNGTASATTGAITLVSPASTAGNTATTAANIQAALNSLTVGSVNIGANAIVSSGASLAASVTGANELGNSVTITTSSALGIQVGQTVTISGVGTAGYNGSFVIASVPSSTTFTYFDATASLGSSSGGFAAVTGPGPTTTEAGGGEYITITFTGVLANSPQSLLVVSPVSLTINTGTPTASTGTTVPGSAALTINSGGTITLDNTSVNNSNRINPSAAIALNGGTLNFLGNGSAASTQTLGAVTLVSGNSTINSANQTGQTATLTIASLTRSAGATVNFTNTVTTPAGTTTGSALGTTSNEVSFTTAPTLASGVNILPFALVTDSNFATYGPSGIVANTTFATTLTGATASTNVILTDAASNTTLSAATSVGSLILVGNVALTINSGITLTIGNGQTTGGMVLLNDGTGSPSLTGGTLAFGSSEAVVETGPGTAARITSATTGTGGMTFSGSGTVILAGPNTNTGTTTLDGGTLTVAANNLGNVPLALIGGTLTAGTTLIVTGATTLNNSKVTIGGSNAIVFAGAVTLAGLNDTLSVTNTAPTVITGVVQDSAISPARALTLNGTKTLTLSGANTYSALTNVLSGTLNIQNSFALGGLQAGTVSATTAPVSAGTIVAAGATLQLQGASNTTGLSVNEPITLNRGTLESLSGNNTIGNAILLSAPSTINVDTNTLQVNGAISGAADLTKIGGGTLVLGGPSSYTGQTNINAGIVQLTTASANNTTNSPIITPLGAVTGSVVVASGATLQLNPLYAATFASKQLVLNGTGLGLTTSTLLLGTGAFENIANFASTWTGAITLGTNDVNNGTDDTLSSTTNTLTITGPISGSGSLTTVGAGTIALGGPETYTGATTVLAGTLSVNGVGQVLNTSGATVDYNAELLFDNTVNSGGSTTGINLTGRFMNEANPANVLLNNAVLFFQGNSTPGVLSADTVGTVTANSGASFIDSASGVGQGAMATLTISTLNRNPGSTLTFLPGSTAGFAQNLNTTDNKILVNSFGPGAGLIDGILPWATVGSIGTTPNQYDFATTVAVNGSNSIAAFKNYTSNIADSGPTSIVRLTANETLTANKVVGAILFAGTSTGASITITQNGFTLGVASGAILSMGNNTLTISGGTVDFGSAEGILDQNNANITVNSTLTGTNGLTITDTTAGTITLAAANSYTGTTTVTGTGTGNVTISNISAFGNGAVTLTSGTVTAGIVASNNTANNAQDSFFALDNPINFNNSVVTFANSTNRFFFTGPITLTGNNQITADANAFGATALSGVVSGTGSLNLLGGAIVMQNPNSTYSGGTNVGGGNLIVTASDTVNGNNVTINGPLGTGALNLTGGIFQASATNVPDLTVNAITLYNAITLINANTIVAGGAPTNSGAGGNITFAGPVTLSGTNTVGVTYGFNFPISGNISGTGNLTKTNVGAMLLSGNNTFTGCVTVTAGTTGVLGNVGDLIVGSNTALGTGLLTLNGGVLQDDGLAPRTLANNVFLTSGTNSFINAINPSTPFTITGTILGPGSLTKGFASLTTEEASMDAVQTLTFGSGITGGTFTLTINGSTTGNITAVAATISTASETNNTVTITAANSFAAGDIVYISGVGVAGYNGTFKIVTATASSFTNTNPTAGLTPSSGGTAFDSTITAANIQSAINALNNSITANYQPVVTGSGATISIGFQNVSVGATITSLPTVAFSSNLSGGTITSSTTTTGTGTLVLASANAYSGTTTINQGTLTLSGGGALAQSGNINAVQTVTFTTAATAGTYTLTFNGQTTTPIAYNATAATVQAALQALPNVGANNLIVGGTGSPSVTASTLSFTFQNALGGVPVPVGLLTFSATGLTGATTAAFTLTTAGVASVVVNPGANFTVDNTGTSNDNRLNTSAAVTLAGGTLNYLGAANTALAQTLGALSFSAGNSTIQTTAGPGGATILNFASLTRLPGGQLTFAAGNGQTLGSATNEILFTVAPILSVGIIKGAITNDAATGTINLAAYGATGIGALGTYTAFTGTATDDSQNVIITTTGTETTGTTPNAILIRGDGITVSGSVAITPTTDEVVVVDTGSIGNNFSSTTVLALGASEGVLYTANTGGSTGAFTLNSAMTGSVTAGSVGLSIGGSGTLNLLASDTQTGNVDLDSGNLVLGTATAVIGPVADNLNAYGGTISASTTNTFTNPLNLDVGAGYMTFTGSNGITLSGIIAGGGSIAFNMATSGTTVTYGAQANTYFGITNVMNGTLNVGSGGDHAWNDNAIATNGGEGDLLIIGNGQAGTQAFVIDNGNNIPNNTTNVINNTGTLTIGTTSGTAGTGDAVGSFILNGGTWQQVSQNVEGSIVVGPSPIPSTVSGTAIALARAGGIASSEGAGDNVINVFQGVGAALGNELTISNQILVGASGAGFVVTKIGAGTVTFTGATASTYTEPTIVDEGTLVLAKSAAVSAMEGTLVVGDFGNAATARVTSAFNNFATTNEPVIVNGGGLFDVSASTVTQTITELDVRGGTVNVGANNLQTNNVITGLAASTTGTTVVSGTITGSINDFISGATESGTIVTITTSTPHGFLVGESVTVTGVGVFGYNGTYTITSVPTPTTFTYTDTAGLVASGGGIAYAGTLLLTQSPTTINVADSGTTPGLNIPAIIAGAVGLTKAGDGTLVLDGSVANTYTGATLVNGGTVLLSDSGGAAINGASLTVGSGLGGQGTNKADVVRVANQPQTLTFGSGITGGTFTLTFNGSTTATITAAAAAITAASESSNTVTITATNNFNPGDTVVISGVGVAGYNGTFTILTATASSFTYTDPTANLAPSSGGAVFDSTMTGANIQAALAALRNVGTGKVTVTGIAPFTVAFANSVVNPGTLLVVSNNSLTPTGSTLTPALINEIAATIPVTIGNSGLLDLNGFSQTIGLGQPNALTISGGTLATETGTLTLGGNIADLANLNNLTPAVISGNLNLGGATRVIDVQAGNLVGQNPNITVPNANDMSISAVISNGGLTKNNIGKLQLTGNNTYTGPTTINGGQLLVDGSQPNSAVLVNSSGTLGGTGTIGSITTAGGTVNPGDPAGSSASLSTGPINLSSGVGVTLEIPNYTGAGATGYDQINLAGELTLGGSSTLTLDLSGLTTTGTASNVITYSSEVGTFSTINTINNVDNLVPIVTYGATSISITFIATDAATHFSVTPSTNSTTAGAAFSVTVTALDANNNQTAGYTGTIAFSSTDTNSGVVLPSNYTFTSNTSASSGFDNGIHTFTGVVLATAGAQTITVMDTNTPSIDGTSGSITVTAATVSQLVFTTTPQTLTAGVVSGTLTVQEEDAYGNVTTTAETVNLSTSNTATGLFKDNATGLTTITSVSIPAGSSTASFKYVDTLAGSPTLTASAAGLTSATQTETIIAAAASQLIFTTRPQTLTAGVTSGTITIEEEDAFGNVSSTAETVNLSTSNTATGLFKDNATGLTTITSVSILAGSSTASFKYIDTLASSPTLTAAATGLTPANQTETVIAAAASKLIFTTTPQTLTAGVVSGTLTVQEEDAYGNVTTTAETVNLSTSNAATGLFKDNATGTTTITSVSIPAGSSTASFKYADTLASSPTLTAAATGLMSAMQTETVIAAAASKLIFITAPQTLTAGVVSGTLTVQEEDAFGNVSTTAETVNLSTSNTSTGLFKDNATGLTTITSVSIPPGISRASFKYVDTLASTPTLTAAATGLTPANQTETVLAAAASQLAFTTAAQTLTAGVTSGTITVQLEDAFNNVASASSTQTILLATTSAFGQFRDNATGNSPITFVNLAAVTSSSSFKYNDTLAGSPMLTVTDFALTSPTATQTETVIAAAASQLVYTTTAQTLTAGVVSGALTVQEEDAYGNVTTTAETVNLSTSNASTGLFKDNATGATITSVSIPAGSSTASFKYVDTLVSSPTLTAAATGLTSAMQTETVIAAAASKLVFTTTPQTIPFGVVSGTLTVQEQDVYGNGTTTAETVNLSTSNVSTGLFKDNATGQTTITSVSIPAGSSTASFKYVDTLPSTPTLTASATGVTPAIQVETITGLTVTSFTPSANGFTVVFSAPFNPATINLNAPVTATTPVAVTLVGSGHIGPVTGSLYFNATDTQATFVTTALVGSNGLPISTGTLPLGSYTVTLVSGPNAFTTPTGQLLDGNTNGSDDNYTQTFNVVASNPGPGDVLLPSSAVIVNVPDFARGPNTPNVSIASSNGAVESGNTVTITTATGHGFSVGQTVVISGVGVSGYNGSFTISSVPTATTFTYTETTSNLAASGSGTANVPDINVANNSANGIPIDLTVLAPVQTITSSSALTAGTTGTFKLGFNGETTANITVGTTIKAATTSASTSGASESGTTVTIRTSSVHGLKVGELVTISGVGVSGYNGTFTVTAVPTTTSFTYTDSTTSLGLSGGGTWTLSAGSLATAIQNALGALSVVGGVANVAVTGSGPYTVTFASAVANPTLLTVASNAISSAPTFTIVNPNAPAAVTDATLVLDYNANLLTITGGTVNAGLSGATFTVSTSGSGASAQATIVFHSSTELNLGTLGSVDLGGLNASTPSTAPYKSKEMLQFVSESINSGALTAVGVNGYQVVAYQADIDGSCDYSSNDASLLAPVTGGTEPGFAAYQLVAPIIIAGVGGSTSLGATDSALLASYLNGVAVPQIPNQTGVTPSNFAPGPDPTVSIPTNLQVGANGVVTVPVNIDDPDPAGSTGMTLAQLAVTYDPTAFTVSPADVQLGTVPASGSGWSLQTVVDSTTGQIAITLSSLTPITTSTAGSLVTIDFHSTGESQAGTTSIKLVSSVNPNGTGEIATSIFDSENRFTLSPAPGSVATGAAVDGLVEQSGATPAATSAPASGEETSSLLQVESAAESGSAAVGLSSQQPGKSDAEPWLETSGALVVNVAAANGTGGVNREGLTSEAGMLATTVSLVGRTQSGNQTWSVAETFPVNGLARVNSPQQQWADWLFAAVARGQVGLDGQSGQAGTIGDTFDRVLEEQPLQMRSRSDNLDNWLWEQSNARLDWLDGVSESAVPEAPSGWQDSRSGWASESALEQAAGLGEDAQQLDSTAGIPS